MAETAAPLAIKPLPQPELEVEEPAVGEPERHGPPRGDWFASGVPAPGRRSAWKDVLKAGMK